MAITPERLLIVLHTAGPLAGQVRGMQMDGIDEVGRPVAGLPLSPEALITFLPTHAKMTAQIADLEVTVVAVTTERDQALAARDAAIEEVAALRAAPPSANALPDISDRQFFQGLAMRGLITPDEALAAVATGTVPLAFEAFVATLSPDQQFAARMVLSGAVSFSYTHPLTRAFAAMHGFDEAALTDLWRFCAAL